MTSAITQTPKVTTWKIDASHSTVEFTAKHMMITNVKGRFPDVDGTIIFDEANPANSSVEAVIKVETVNTGSEQRDVHLRSGDFFQVEQFPTMIFKSTRVEPKGDDEYSVLGDLTIRGVTRPVTLAATYEGRGVTPYGVEAIGFTATTAISRKDFDLNWNVALEAGGVLVSDKIKIELNLQAAKNVDQAEKEAAAETNTGANA